MRKIHKFASLAVLPTFVTSDIELLALVRDQEILYAFHQRHFRKQNSYQDRNTEYSKRTINSLF